MNRSFQIVLLISLIISAISCKQRGQGANPLARPTERKIIGPGVDYDPIGVPGDVAELALAEKLATSFEARRAHGWEVFRRVIRPVSVSASRDDRSEVGMIPVFQTWYDAGEVQELFQVFYKLVRQERGRTDGGRPREEIFNTAWTAYHEQASIGPDRDRILNERFQGLLEQIQNDPVRVGGLNGFGASAGVNGRGVVLMSPQLIRAFMINYEAAVRCQERSSNPANPVILRPESGDLAGAFSKALQRFSDDEFGVCFGQPLPRGAVAVKLTWSRVAGPATVSKIKSLANYDTAETGITGMLAKGGTWRIADQDDSIHPRTVPVPGFEGIYRVRTDNGHEWALTGLHVTTRETREWVWLTLWWGGDSPSNDFGSDRPELCDASEQSCSNLGNYFAPWNAYKMCMVSAWREGDPVMNSQNAAEFERRSGSIGARWSAGLLAAARSTRAAYTPERRSPDGQYYTWCSNPFIEFEAGMANSNCIGCHQFAAPGATFDQVEHNRFDKMTKDFPADFLWSFDSGANHTADRILGVVRALDGTQ
jgi:hypothetical protein